MASASSIFLVLCVLVSVFGGVFSLPNNASTSNNASTTTNETITSKPEITTTLPFLIQEFSSKNSTVLTLVLNGTAVSLTFQNITIRKNISAMTNGSYSFVLNGNKFAVNSTNLKFNITMNEILITAKPLHTMSPYYNVSTTSTPSTPSRSSFNVGLILLCAFGGFCALLILREYYYAKRDDHMPSFCDEQCRRECCDECDRWCKPSPYSP